jgi:hypothetical protein
MTRRSMRPIVYLGLMILTGLTQACAVGLPSPDEEEVGEPGLSPTVAGAGAVTPRPARALPSSSDCPAYPPDFSLVTGREVYPVPDLPEPAPRQWSIDPTFGTCLVRVTDRANDLAADDTSTGLVNEYARVQSFNADGSQLLVRSTDGTWYLYDAQTLLPLGELPIAVEPRWDADDPDVLYHLDETRLMSLNVRTGEQAEVRDFARDFPGQNLAAVWTRYEGSPSRDRRYWGLMAEDEDWIPVAFVVYDRQADRVTIRDMRGVPGVEDDVDHVTMSPLGTYFLASFDLSCEEGQLGADGHPCGLMVYDRDLTNGRGLLRIIGHYDPALDTQGREVIVYQDIDTDHISMLDLTTGTALAGRWSRPTTTIWPVTPGWTTRSSPSNCKRAGAWYSWRTPTRWWTRASHRSTTTGPSRTPAPILT